MYLERKGKCTELKFQNNAKMGQMNKQSISDVGNQSKHSIGMIQHCLSQRLAKTPRGSQLTASVSLSSKSGAILLLSRTPNYLS